MARTRRSFTDEFKREAVRLAEQPESNVSKIAQDLGVDPSVLRRWVTQMRGGTWEPTAGKPLKSAQQQEIEQLLRELAKVKTERDILKKSGGILCQGPDMKYPFIARHRAVWSVSELCRVLGVSRSGFYEWHGRAPSSRERANTRLTGRIRESFESSDRTYGSPRVWRDLRAWGENFGRHRVARLMRAAHLVARARRRRHPSDTEPRLHHTIAANVLDRDFTAEAPNQKWVAEKPRLRFGCVTFRPQSQWPPYR